MNMQEPLTRRDLHAKLFRAEILINKLQQTLRGLQNLSNNSVNVLVRIVNLNHYLV